MGLQEWQRRVAAEGHKSFKIRKVDILREYIFVAQNKIFSVPGHTSSRSHIQFSPGNQFALLDVHQDFAAFLLS